MSCRLKAYFKVPALNIRKTVERLTTQFLWWRNIPNGMELIAIPWCPQNKTDGSSHFYSVGRTSWNVLCLMGGGWAGVWKSSKQLMKVQVFASGAWEEQRARAKDQLAFRHFSQWGESDKLPFGSRCRYPSIKERCKKKERKERKRQCQIGATWRNQVARWSVRLQANWQKIEEEEELSREKRAGFSYTGNPLKVLIYSRVKAASSEVRKEA